MAENEFRDFRLALVADQGTPEDSQRVADGLVRDGKLTRFQADLLLAGTSTGLVYGNYVVRDQVGQGGMGFVYEAEHRRMHRRVALKVLNPRALKSDDSIRRFHREVQAAARLTHPNIVAAYDADESQGTHFLVMELVTGSDLSAYVKKHGPLPVSEAVDYVIQAARGLDYAHNAGIVHRDIKPANLLLDGSGTVKVLDLGMARLDESLALANSAAATITQTGSIMGTIDFMSPEQALDTRHVDRRADIYSLGCSLFYLLTGRPVFPGDTMMKKLLAHREQPIPSLRAHCPEVGPELDAIFTRMVAKRPEDRYQTMADVIRELQQARGWGSNPFPANEIGSGGPHHSTLALGGIPGAAEYAETYIGVAVKPVPDVRAATDPVGETRKQQATTHETPPRAAIESRRLSRRQWFALALSTGLLVMVAAFLQVTQEPAGRPRAEFNFNRDHESPVLSQQAPGDENPKLATRGLAHQTILPADGWIDLSTLIDVDRDAVFGKWKRQDEALIGSDPGRDSLAARLILPCRTAGGYELSFRLRRIDGESAVTLILPVGGRSVALVLAGFPDLPGETVPLTGLHLLDQKPLPLSPERVRGPKIETGRAYQARVRVSVAGAAAAIALDLDDERIMDWKGNVDRLEPAPLYQIPAPQYLGLGVFNSTVELHDIEFRVTQGEAHLGGHTATAPVDSPPG